MMEEEEKAADKVRERRSATAGVSESSCRVLTLLPGAQDTWFPAHRNCSCCKGYVNACTAPMCLDLGVCGCTLEDSDIHAAAE